MRWIKPHQSNCLILNNYNHVIDSIGNENHYSSEVSGSSNKIDTDEMESIASNRVVYHKVSREHNWTDTCFLIFLIIASLLLLNVDIVLATEQQCEPKTLEEIPPDPVNALILMITSHNILIKNIPYELPFQYYDASYVTEDAAKKLTDYLNSIKPVSALTTEIRQTANTIALDALNYDEGLLAIAIAAPSLKLAVVQFRQHVDNPINISNNHSYLSTYWRELGEAWNRSDGAQFWGAPFRDCGAMHGRWLWPFSINYQQNGIK